MTRLRGRPKRGSPWKPRRPAFSRSDSSSLSSSSRSRSGQFSEASRNRATAHFNCRALVPRTAGSPSQHLRDPPVITSVPEPEPQQTSRGAGPLPRDSFTTAQLWDSLATLYDLVFGIRQSVEDLNYRLQETDVKVDLFLRTLNSLQDTLASSQNEDAPMAEPEVAADAAADVATGADRGRKVDGTVDDGAGDKNLGRSTHVHRGGALDGGHPAHVAQLFSRCLTSQSCCRGQ
jgi:hypothetical protein